MFEILRKAGRALFNKLGIAGGASLGVDIGPDAVRVVQMSRVWDGYRIDNYVIHPLPADVVVDGNINDVPAVGEAVSQAVEALRPVAKTAAVAVGGGVGGMAGSLAENAEQGIAGSAEGDAEGGAEIVVRNVEMDAVLTDSEMESQIMLEAEQHIPWPPDDAAIDFERQQISEQNPDLVEVLLVACRQESVDARVAALKIGGLTAAVVDVEAYVMQRVCTLLLGQLDAGVSAIFTLDTTLITLAIMQGGASLYSREQVFGDAQTDEQECRDLLVQQISQSLQFFFSSSHHDNVNHIILAGPLAALDGLADRVQENLSTPTRIANPFANLEIGPRINQTMLKHDAPALLIACGLAMRGGC
ncbi:MAG: type IV pilus biogenesis protein PilM [Pseudohongiellaceae bacterium]